MDILVCVKRVPDPSENDIRLNRQGNDIEKDDLVYSVNEWDNYAVEEAIQIVDKIGGSVTVASVGSEEEEEVLRRQMAMGANKGVLLSDAMTQQADGRKIARFLSSYVSQNSFDLILCGAQSDEGASQVGGMMAALLDRPYASLVNMIEVVSDSKLKIGREIEGGNQEINEIEMPCVLSIQTGINEPRYVSIRGIRKVASLEIPALSASDIGCEDCGLRLQKLEYFQPEMGAGAEMLAGNTEEMAEKVAEMLKAKGGIR